MSDILKAAAFGEILWDILPEKKCLGGAPFNCAAHLNRLGFQSSMISSLGKDRLGDEARAQIRKEHISTEFVQISSSLPTGFTRVTLENGIPSYEFNSPCAWDGITLSENQMKQFFATHWNIFCFGSLAQRSEKSRNTLLQIFKRLKADTVFFDVNLRKQFFNREIITSSLEYTDILKMNDEEVPVLLSLLGYSGTEKDFIDSLIQQYSLKCIIITRGKKGADVFFKGKIFTRQPEPVQITDTVGAGDSFSAAFLASYAKGHSIQDALSAGILLADYVVSHQGALPEYDRKIQQQLQPFISGN